MSMESAKAFINRMKTDEEFAKQVSECKDNEARMAFAVDNGFSFSGNEIKEAAAHLTDDELEMLAGGRRGIGSGEPGRIPPVILPEGDISVRWG